MVKKCMLIIFLGFDYVLRDKSAKQEALGEGG